MRLYVPITRDEFRALLEQAQAQRRRPQDQAALLLSTMLRTGVKPKDPIRTASENEHEDTSPEVGQ